VRLALRRGWLLAAIGLVVGSLLCFLFVWWLGEPLFNIADSEWIALLLAVCVLAWGIIQLCAALLRSFHDSRWSILLTGQFGGPLSNCILIALSMLLVCLWSPVTLVQSLLCSAIALCVVTPLALKVTASIGRRRLAEIGAEDSSRSTLQTAAFASLVGICCPLMLTQCLSYVTGQADIWIGGALVSHDDMALYGAARRLMLLIGIPMQLVNLTVIASIAELRAQNKHQELQRILRSAATMAAVPALLVSLPILIFPSQILSLLFGSFYAEGATLLRILCVGQIVFVCAGAAELTLMMGGQQMKALWINIGTSLVMFALGVLLTRNWSVYGLAIAWSCVVSLQCIGFGLCARWSVGVWTIMDIGLLAHSRHSYTSLVQKVLKKGQ
jgi:O-antigen/teichoic acid export membrane protein